MTSAPKMPKTDDMEQSIAPLLSPSETAAYDVFVNERSKFIDGALYVGTKRFFPSAVLRELDPKGYMDGIEDFRKARVDEIADTVVSSFPTPIAFWFYMFNNVYDSELQRWSFLKDTWEATIRILHAIVVADALRARAPLQSTKGDKFSAKSILSDSMDQLIENIEQIVSQCGSKKELRLDTLQLLGKGTPNQLRTLNRLRNSFAHEQTPNEKQATAKIDEALSELIPIFDDLRALSEMKLLRFRRNHETDHRVVHCEPFQGSSTTPARLSLQFTDDEQTEIRSFNPSYLVPENVLLWWNRKLLCLSPLFYVRETENRHGSQLCMFKRTRMTDDNERTLEYEVLGESGQDLIPREIFEGHIQAINNLFENQINSKD